MWFVSRFSIRIYGVPPCASVCVYLVRYYILYGCIWLYCTRRYGLLMACTGETLSSLLGSVRSRLSRVPRVYALS